MPTGWVKIGQGSYNAAYRSEDNKTVLKIQHRSSPTDTPERSVRLWNTINSDIQPPASLVEIESRPGWVCPFIKGRASSDSEMARALIGIYNRSGRIVVDATAPKNFVTTNEGKVVCIDIGMALQLESREELTTRRRSGSIDSINYWQSTSMDYQNFFKSYEALYPNTVNTVKALVFIQENRPDIFDAEFLNDNPSAVSQLVRAYDEQVELKKTKNDLIEKCAIIKTNMDKIFVETQRNENYSSEEKQFIEASCHKLKLIIKKGGEHFSLCQSSNEIVDISLDSYVKITEALNQIACDSLTIPGGSGLGEYISNISNILECSNPLLEDTFMQKTQGIDTSNTSPFSDTTVSSVTSESDDKRSDGTLTL